jgi:uncharacterized membrane protein
MKKRFKNPVFLIAVAGLLYQALQQANIKLDLGTYQQLVDVISYIAIGTGIYSKFENKGVGINE